ncbi:MAG: hypothetical protein ACJAW8_001916 [Oleispira sp.]|jgi:hypothetical protein
MSVFISYRRSDLNLAKDIKARLDQHGIASYLDVLDGESQQTDDITKVITKRVNECTHLIAIVTHITAQSWWVPFEIGEATITNKRICSFRAGNSSLPEYLDKWPQMTALSDMHTFIKNYKKGELTAGLEHRNRSYVLNSVSAKANAEEFHATMKRDLRPLVY